MTKAEITIEQAIVRSQAHNETVLLGPDPSIDTVLQTLCDDYADVDCATEYWGSDPKNGAWRVRVWS